MNPKLQADEYAKTVKGFSSMGKPYDLRFAYKTGIRRTRIAGKRKLRPVFVQNQKIRFERFQSFRLFYNHHPARIKKGRVIVLAVGCSKTVFLGVAFRRYTHL